MYEWLTTRVGYLKKRKNNASFTILDALMRFSLSIKKYEYVVNNLLK